MKKIIFLTILIASVIIPSVNSAQSNSAPSFEEIFNEILKSQNINQKSQIDCNKVTDGQLESLGDAVMSFMHPDERQHELMDQMMGGEGSQSLQAAHILMGRNYLGCSETGFGGGMMGNGMMSMTGWGMMGNFGQFGAGGWFFGLLMIVFWILVIVALILLIKWLIKQNQKQ